MACFLEAAALMWERVPTRHPFHQSHHPENEVMQQPRVKAAAEKENPVPLGRYGLLQE